MPNEESSNCVSQADDTSQATTVEACDLQPRQRSDATHDVSESHKEERTSSSKNEKDSDMLLQKPSSNPGVPAQEPNPPPASLLIRDDKALKKVHGSISSRVPPHFSKIRKDKADNMHLRQSPNSGVQTSETCDGERNSTTREMVLDILLPAQNLRGALASQSDKQKLLYSTRPEKTVEKLQPRRNPDNGGCSSQSYQVTVPSSISETLPSMPKEECNTQKRETVSNDLVHVSSLSGGVPVPQPNQEKFTYSTKPEKVEKLQPRRNPDPVVQGLQSDGESTPSKIVEKGQHDGYNWRKYGQKLVKGNKFVRSYYKCTFPNCQAKKQVERSHDGCKTDINYLGKHHHQKPQHNSPAFQIRTPEIPVISATKSDLLADAEPIVDYGGTNLHMVPKETSHQSTVPRSVDDVIGAVSCSNDDNNTSKDDYPDSKRQKREIISADDNAVNRSHSDLRHVVQTLSEVDIVNDGYRWRKYGQKLVKGNPNPRSYYRCSNAGCPVKKHVERASHDSKVVITTYEGQHDHDMPLSKPVGQSTTADDANMIATNGESRSKPEESNPVSLEMVVHAS